MEQFERLTRLFLPARSVRVCVRADGRGQDVHHGGHARRPRHQLPHHEGALPVRSAGFLPFCVSMLFWHMRRTAAASGRMKWLEHYVGEGKEVEQTKQPLALSLIV